MESRLITDPRLAAVLEDLERREPVFRWPELWTTRRDFENMIDVTFREVGASGKRYSRQIAIDPLVERYSQPHHDVWETSGFHCEELAPDTYLQTYTLVQGETRVARRASIWCRAHDGLKSSYHQGTLVDVP